MYKQNILSGSIALALVGAVTTAQAEPLITDYKEATSAYEDAYLSGSFNLNSGNQDQTSYNLDLQTDYEKVFSSPDRNTKIDFLGTGSIRKGGNSGDEKEDTYQALGSVTSDKYFHSGSKGAFWYGKGAIGLKKGQEDPFTKVTAGLGYGRVVNVTPMAKAIRVVQELREKGSLKSDPSNATYQTIAEIISKENEYRAKYGFEDYEQNWIGDIESALAASGTITAGDKLSAKGILKSYDVLTNERISTRKAGWLVRAGVGAVITDYDGEKGKPAVEVGAEYHHPISNQTQFSNEAIATATLDDDNDGYVFNNAMSLTHELTDRVDWENKWLLNHSSFDESNDITKNTVSSTFLYSISNQLDFSVEAKLTDTEDDIDNNGNDDLDKSLNMGIKYRLK
ncbi:MAG: hypothetical protein CR955_00845 [Thiotrichales bacterium]|nr:MAG: hypothetical protein CR955_00845 [Thiotrichales bacterium]